MAMYRGLSTFISDVRNAKSKEDEQRRVDKELANVRKAFTSGSMTPYDRKKYVWKLVFVNMLGYDVDFGHMEMISLLSQPTYAEKLVGYLSTSVLLRNTDEQITLVVQAIKNDLQSTQDPIQCLALCAIANIGGKELAESVAPDVQRILFSRSIFPVVRKKAALCLLRLVRISRDLLPADEWSKKLVTLLEDKNLGVVLSVVTLILGLAEREPSSYEGATGHLLVWLTRLAVGRSVAEDYMYHGTPCPWLQVRILRLLQFFPIPATEVMRTRLSEVVTHILNKTEVTKSVNRNNAEHCVLFEAVNLIIKQGDASEPALRAKAVAHLSKFINIREPNIRYLGLETMSRLAVLDGTGDAIRKQQATIMFSLKDADISIRRRALDLLFAMCDHSIAESMVKELLQYLAIADWAIKDEMVLKLAILSERFAPNLRWYVDTIMQLIAIAGDFVSDDVWHRVVQIVTNHEDLQMYAASKMYHSVEPVNAHETTVKVAGYLLGEFGFLLNEKDVDSDVPVTGVQQFAALHQHFPKCTSATKCILLSTYAKMQNLYPELRAQVLPIFEAHTTVIDAELQQRAVEYLHLPSVKDETLAAVLDAMPPFPERASMLEARLKKSGEETQDKDVFGKEEKDTVTKDDDDDEEETPSASKGAGPRRASGEGASPAPAPAPATGDLMDLLGDLSAPAPVDPLSVPVTNRIAVNPADAEKLQGMWTDVTIKPAAVLYDDAHVQVGVKTKFTGADGRIGLFIGNRLAVPLVGFKLRVPDSPAMKVTVSDVPTTVPAKQQVQVTITLESMQPFAEPPALQVSFISAPGTGHAYALRLPVAVHNFCEAVSMPGPDYRTRWTALAGAPKDVTAIVTPGAAGVTREKADDALSKINMSVIDAGAPGATGASSFRTHFVGPAGTPVAVGCLVMIIPDAATGVYKVAVRTQHPDVSASLMRTLQHVLTH